MRSAYERVGLERGKDKGFEGQLKASFWGASVNGVSGDIRALPARALPVMSLVLETAKFGLATSGLLKVRAGCLVRLFFFWRRLLSCLDLIHSEGRPLPKNQVFKMTPRLRDELWTAALLIPVAASNMRVCHSPWLLATDASLQWKAEVRAKIGAAFGEELWSWHHKTFVDSFALC